MLSYDEFETFRAPKPKGRAMPNRDLALDDLHRTLYGSLHPSAGRLAEEDAALVGEEKPASWLEDNAALTAAIAIVGVIALAAALKKKAPPLQGPPDPTPAV